MTEMKLKIGNGNDNDALFDFEFTNNITSNKKQRLFMTKFLARYKFWYIYKLNRNFKTIPIANIWELILASNDIKIDTYIDPLTGEDAVDFYIKDYNDKFLYKKITTRTLDKIVYLIDNCLEASINKSSQIKSGILNKMNGSTEYDFDETYIDPDTKKEFKKTNVFGDPLLGKLNIPPKHIVLFENGIYDMKLKTFYGYDNPNNYHFITKIPFNYVPLNETSNKLMVSIVDRVFDIWSNNDPEFKLYLFQILFAVLDGNGRGRYHIFKSEGGDGKSSFGKIAAILAGSQYTKNINLNQFDDDNAINGLSKKIRLIFGDDLQTKSRLNETATSRFKSLWSNGAVNVNVKYKDNINVSTNAVGLQMTNTDIQFAETGAAMEDRLICIDWPNNNFRRNPITDFSLSELIGDSFDSESSEPNSEFFEVLIAKILDTVDYFEKFSIPTTMQANARELLDSSDNVSLFLNNLYSMGLLNFKRIPTNVLYLAYIEWLKAENPAAKPSRSATFASSLFNRLSRYNFEKNDKKVVVSKVCGYDYEDFNLDIFNHQTGLNITIDPKNRTSVIENKNFMFSQDEYDIRLNKLRTDDDYREIAIDSVKDLQVICHEFYINGNTEFIDVIDQLNY